VIDSGKKSIFQTILLSIFSRSLHTLSLSPASPALTHTINDGRPKCSNTKREEDSTRLDSTRLGLTRQTDSTLTLSIRRRDTDPVLRSRALLRSSYRCYAAADMMDIRAAGTAVVQLFSTGPIRVDNMTTAD